MSISSVAQPSTVHVAVAVIRYQDQYLLGYRHQHQHQGDRYEFVGGKIEANEQAVAALCREVEEETGICIHTCQKLKLGRLHHDYGDKHVCLHVYEVCLSQAQYAKHQYQDQGLEGQTLTWVGKEALLAGHYSLPAANATILAWLRLPRVMGISYPVSAFEDACHPNQAWLEYHLQLPKSSALYIRPQADVTTEHAIIESLLTQRPDLYAMTSYTASAHLGQVHHVNQRTLLSWYDAPDSLSFTTPLPLFISCHDKASIEAANCLTKQRLAANLSPVVGIFLSPIHATVTHPDAIPLGWEAFSKLAEIADMPVIALGGMHPNMAQMAAQYGAYAVAGIRAFMPSVKV